MAIDVSLAIPDYVTPLGAPPDALKSAQEQQARDLTLKAQALQNASGQQALDEQQQFIADVKHFGVNPTPQGMAYMASRYPKASEAFKRSWDMVEKPEQQHTLTNLGEIWSAARNNHWDLATQLAQARVDAEREAGTATEDDQRVLDLMRSNDPSDRQLAIGMLSHFMASVEPDKFGATLHDIGEERRADELFPSEVAAKRAEAASAPDYYANRARNEGAQADVNAAEAQSAPAYYAAHAQHEKALASIASTDSAWAAADHAAADTLKKTQVNALRSLITLRGKETEKAATDVSVGEVMAPIYSKVAAGKPLSPGEAAAFAAFTHAPATQRLLNQPARAPAGSQRPSSPQPRSSDVRYFVNRQTGQREAFKLVNGRWQKM